MSPVQVHLLVVHIPVIGLVGVLILLLAAWFARQEALRIAGYGFLLACTAGAIAAYASGPPALDQLKTHVEVANGQVENHALLGRGLTVALVIAAMIALNALMQVAQGATVPRWQHALLLVAVALLCYLAAWTAHSGGFIRHLELQARDLPLFPRL